MFAEMSLENRALKNLIEKSSDTAGKREAVVYLTTEKQLRNCKTFKPDRYLPHYLSV